MGFVFDPLQGESFHEHPVRRVSANPASAKEGSLIINTTDGGMKIFYGGVWQTLHTLTSAALTFFLQEDGTSFFLLEDGVSKLAKES